MYQATSIVPRTPPDYTSPGFIRFRPVLSYARPRPVVQKTKKRKKTLPYLVLLWYNDYNYCVLNNRRPCSPEFGRVTEMKCPYCGYKESKVVDSRPADEGSSIRRRRECLKCEKRFTTYETVESLPMVVIKKDGSRQSFDRNKILRGIQRSCEKRPVPVADMERMASEIEQELQNSLERETSTEVIGEKVMEKLKAADEVAYVRFASVYRQFKDINTFMSELNKLLNEK